MNGQKKPAPLWETGRTLTAVAVGREPADLVIRNARLVNVCTGEIQPGIDVAVKAGRIALVGDASHCVGEGTRVLDAGGKYLAPGLLDGHIHIESSMLSVGEYARAVVPHGTTGVMIDPHEICNVLGMRGVRCMMEDAMRTPLDVMITTPSCVPAVPGLEDTGAEVTAADVRDSMAWASVVGLGEMMNFPGILAGDALPHDEIAETLKAGRVVTGHFPEQDTGPALSGYIAAGVRCCHESTRKEDAIAKMRLGMYTMLREGSAWNDLREVAKAVTECEVDSRFAVLVSDDAHPHTLVGQGHMNHILRRAVEEGIDPVKAVQMATLNTAQCFRLDHDIGSVTPGKRADLVLFCDLRDFRASVVLVGGEVVAREGEMVAAMPPYRYPDWAYHSMHVGGAVSEASFRIPYDGEAARCRVIEVMSGSVANRMGEAVVRAKDGALESDPDGDLLKVKVFERHHATGRSGAGFVRGFGIRRGAMASTVAHDAHNLLVLGENDRDMAVAANALIACGGGMAVAMDGEVLALVELPLAGLMSDLGARETASGVEALEHAWEALGCRMPSPFLTMASLSLACIPELRITNRGLVDMKTFAITELVME